MPIITPTVTAENAHQFREQLQRLEPFAKRIHLDLMDGEFAPSRSIGTSQLFWSDSFEQVDVHLMYQRPGDYLDDLISLKPSLIILHAEAEGDLTKLIKRIQSAGVKAGISLLKDSQIEDYENLVGIADHALIFSGNLGYFGGQVDLSLLSKVQQVTEINPDAEIGWDGGINDENAAELAKNGIDVLNVGGFIQRSEDPQKAFDLLNNTIST